MYSAGYGYQNAAAGPMFNGAPPQGGHLQPGPPPNQPQQIMYNAQQFPLAGQPGPFPGGPNAALMGGAGPAGMVQNAAVPHMAANGQMAFQAPFTTSPYVAAIPSSVAPQPQLPANFMMAGQMPPYQMNAGLPGQQPMMQRMLPAQQNPAAMSVATPQRSFNPQQGTPTGSVPPQQPPFSTPQQQSTLQSQTPTTSQHPPTSAATPQTPTFPVEQGQPQVNGTSNGSAPQSPATESRDKERFAILLEINQELLYESIQLINSRNELKKEQAAAEAGGASSGDVNYAEEEKLANLDYNQCMRRLQANLAYMFALVDRKGKPQLPAPAFLTPPPLSLNLKLKLPPNTPDDPVERPADPVADRVERDHLIKNLYRKLQSLYPGVDPNKEPAAAAANQNPARVGAGAGNPNATTNAAAGGGAQALNLGSPATAPTSGQQPQGHPRGQGAAGTPLMANAAAPGLQQQGQYAVSGS